MIPSAQNVFDLTRALLGDTEVSPGGQIYTNAYLLGAGSAGPWTSAYQWLFERMLTAADRRVRKTSYGLVNPYISYFSPATFGINNLGYLIDMWERPLNATGGTYAITGISLTPASTGVDPYALVSIAHGGTIITGQTIETYLVQGIDDSINDSWTVIVPDNNHVQLMGCTAVGTWTSSTGMVLVASQGWTIPPMARFNDLVEWQNQTSTQAASSLMQSYVWLDGAIRVPPITVQEEVRLTYMLSGTPPSDVTVGIAIDDCLNPLAYRLAAIAGKAKNHPQADEFMAQSDVYLEQFLQPSVKDLQRQRIVAAPFRRRRNTAWSIPY